MPDPSGGVPVSESVPRGNRPAPLDEESVIDNAVPSAARFGQVPRTEVIRSIVLAIHEQGLMLAPAEPPEVAAAEHDWFDAALRAERLTGRQEIVAHIEREAERIGTYHGDPAATPGGTGYCIPAAVATQIVDKYLLDEVGVAGLTEEAGS